MAGRPAAGRRWDIVDTLTTIIQTTSEKNELGLATTAELVVGRQAIRFMLATADLAESQFGATPSARQMSGVAKIRRYCGQHELRLTRMASEFCRR